MAIIITIMHIKILKEGDSKNTNNHRNGSRME